MNREEWLKKLESKNTPSPLNDGQKVIDAMIREHIKTHGKITYVEGPFNDQVKNLGFIQEQVKTEKGIQTKFYGCSYLFKVDLKRETIDSVALTKRVLMSTIEQVLWGKMLFFSFKAFIYWFVRIYEADLQNKTYKNLSDFSPLPRELISAGMKCLEKIRSEEYRAKVNKFLWAIG